MSINDGRLPADSVKDSSLLNPQVTEEKSVYRTGSDGGKAAFSSTPSALEAGHDSNSSYLGGRIDQLAPLIDTLEINRDYRAVHRPHASLQEHTRQSGEGGSEGGLTDSDGESAVHKHVGSLPDSILSDGCSLESVPGNDYEDDDSDDDITYLDTSHKPKYSDRVTQLGYAERLPDIDGKRHYRIELDIDKSLEEDKVRTKLMTISLSRSKLSILNRDGLQPKLASDLETFNNGLLEIKKSPVSGYGVFAVRDLDRYTPILIERELFSASAFDLYKQLDALTEEQRKAYHALHGHKRTPSEDIRAAIWRTNRFSIRSRGSVFLVASRFNHACNDRNNVDYAFDYDKACMAFTVKKKVEAGSELFIHYGSGPKHLFATWGFRCACGGCAGISEEECKAIETENWNEDGSSRIW